jgi:hypothetical protein
MTRTTDTTRHDALQRHVPPVEVAFEAADPALAADPLRHCDKPSGYYTRAERRAVGAGRTTARRPVDEGQAVASRSASKPTASRRKAVGWGKWVYQWARVAVARAPTKNRMTPHAAATPITGTAMPASGPAAIWPSSPADRLPGSVARNPHRG